MILACTGGRHYEAKTVVYRILDEHKPTRVFVGDCPRGVDFFVACWCRERDVPISVFVAEWKRLGLRAGPIRNIRMMEALLKEGGKTLLAFPGGKGTLSCKMAAWDLGIDVKEVGAIVEEEQGEEHA